MAEDYLLLAIWICLVCGLLVLALAVQAAAGKVRRYLRRLRMDRDSRNLYDLGDWWDG